jgi:hypothetical protein
MIFMQPKKKRQRTKYSEINVLVEELVNHGAAPMLTNKRCSTDPSLHEGAKSQVFRTDSKAKSPTANSILKCISKELSTENQQILVSQQEKVSHLNFQSDEYRNNDTCPNLIQQQPDTAEIFADEKIPSETKQPHGSPETDMSIEQCNILLDLFGNSVIPQFSTVEMDTKPPVPSECFQQLSDTAACPMTATTTCNMLETLLRRSGEASSMTNSFEKLLNNTI